MIPHVLNVRRSSAISVVFALLIIGGAAGSVLSIWAQHPNPSPALSGSVTPAGCGMPMGYPNGMGFAPVLKPSLAAVVNISSSRVVRTPVAPFDPLYNDPFFRQFFGDQFSRRPPREER